MKNTSAMGTGGLDFQISKSDQENLSKMFLGLADIKKNKYLMAMLTRAARPIVNIVKQEAKSKIKTSETRIFKRKGTKYTIKAGTIVKSIGVIKNNKAHVPMISVGYRARSPFDGWFAHFLDAGTDERFAKRTRRVSSRQSKSKPSRGRIEPMNIMPSGERGISNAKGIFEKELSKLISQFNK